MILDAQVLVQERAGAYADLVRTGAVCLRRIDGRLQRGMGAARLTADPEQRRVERAGNQCGMKQHERYDPRSNCRRHGGNPGL
ncbi:MAG TPA: hypothetical protein PKO41_04265 [Dokdonella sp.]|nr:hypothetical protein [Dokdonella sp.]